MINDYAELVAEVSARSGVTDVANRAKMLVGMAEADLSDSLELETSSTRASLPPLEVHNTNWLLERAPEIYVLAVLFQVYSAAKDIEAASITRSLLDHQIAKLDLALKREWQVERKICLNGIPL